MKTSIEGINFIKARESFRSRAYKPLPNSEEPWTIGYGSTVGVHDGDTITEPEAMGRLARELIHYEDLVNQACALEPNQNQFDALVSLAYNCEAAVSRKSSVIKAHNRGDFSAAANAFDLYDMAHGKHEPGLLKRRKMEGAKYLTPVTGESPHAMPQAVDLPPTFMASNINKGGVIAGGAGALAAVQPVVDAVNAFKSGVDSLGTWLVPLAIIVAIAAVGYMVYERIQLRKKGIV